MEENFPSRKESFCTSLLPHRKTTFFITDRYPGLELKPTPLPSHPGISQAEPPDSGFLGFRPSIQ